MEDFGIVREKHDSYRRRLERAIGMVRLEEVQELFALLVESREKGSTVFLAGNGGSASTCSHIATDWMLGSGLHNPPLRVLSLTDNAASVTATGNDEAFDRIFLRQLTLLSSPGDVLIVLSASGNSPNLINSVNAAKEMGLRTVSITGFDGGELRRQTEISLHVTTEMGDYGVAEDCHLALGHLIKECLIGIRENR